MPVKIISNQEESSNSKQLDPNFLTRSQFETSEEAFYQNFELSNHNKIQRDSQNFEYSDLIKLCDENNENSLIIIHLALDEYNNMLYGFSGLIGTFNSSKNTIEYPYIDSPSHVLINGNLEKINYNHNWISAVSRYKHELRINRLGTGFYTIKHTDPEMIVFPLNKEIKKMYDDTKKANTDHRVRIESISLSYPDTDGGPLGYRHGIAFCLMEPDSLNEWSPMLDDHHYLTTVRNKAADFGNLCPTKCGEYTFPT